MVVQLPEVTRARQGPSSLSVLGSESVQSLWSREQPSWANPASQSHVPLCQSLWLEDLDAFLRCSGWPCLLLGDTSLPLVDPGSWQRTENSRGTILPSSWAPHRLVLWAYSPSPWTMGLMRRSPSHLSFHEDGIATASPEHEASFFPSAGRSFHLPFQWSLFVFLVQGTQEICFSSSMVEKLEHHLQSAASRCLNLVQLAAYCGPAALWSRPLSPRHKNQNILGLDPESARDQGKAFLSSPGEGLSQAAPVWESLSYQMFFWKMMVLTPSKEELHGGQDGENGQPPSSRSGLLCGCYEASGVLRASERHVLI